MRRWIIIAVFIFTLGLVAVSPAGAVSPYPVLKERADRFFSQKEWRQAVATYELMLDERPDVPETYGRAIVANGMHSDMNAETALMEKALDHHVPFDSVFSRVREFSFSLGKAVIYEDFLKGVREKYPWMKRTVDAQLLNYYTFRRNGKMMDSYSKAMLAGNSDNVKFRSLQAEGYVFQGLIPRAMQAYRDVLDADPDNIEALLYLGNWYAIRAREQGNTNAAEDRGMAAHYLSRAYSLRPTPYVASLLKDL